MMLNSFYIEGPMRELLIIMEGILIFLYIEQVAILWMRRKSGNLNELRGLQENAYMWLFFGYGCMWIFIVIADFHIDDPFLRIIILNIGFFIEILCNFVFIYSMEKNIILKKKFLFSKIYIILFIVFLICVFVAIDFAAYISSLFWIMFFFFFTFYFIDLASRFHLKQDLGNLKKSVFFFYIGFLFTFLGYALTTRFLINVYGLTTRFFGDLFQIIGFLMLSRFFLTVPSITEYYWREELRSIYIVHKSGLLIFEKHFNKEHELINESVITGTLTMIKMILDEHLETHEKSILEKDNKTIIIQPKEFIYGIAISNRNLTPIHILLNKFLERIEMIYYYILENWSGDLQVLSPIEDIANEIFNNL
ncbi:MAG: hypothetical protein ACFFAO_15545 [Candidatus Hermodarchaeota archaeon]